MTLTDESDVGHCSDSGGQYRDGTCDTTRTIHFGRPSAEQCEAFTRVLQGHVRLGFSSRFKTVLTNGPFH